MHPVFHVSRLKKFLHPGDTLVEGIVFFQEIHDNARRKPTRILDRGVMQVRNWKISTVLVTWHGLPLSDATWESVYELRRAFPEFIIEDTDA